MSYDKQTIMFDMEIHCTDGVLYYSSYTLYIKTNTFHLKMNELFDAHNAHIPIVNCKTSKKIISAILTHIDTGLYEPHKFTKEETFDLYNTAHDLDYAPLIDEVGVFILNEYSIDYATLKMFVVKNNPRHYKKAIENFVNDGYLTDNAVTNEILKILRTMIANNKTVANGIQNGVDPINEDVISDWLGKLQFPTH